MRRTNSWRWMGAVMAGGMVLGWGARTAGADETVKIRLCVTVPAVEIGKDTLYVAGDQPCAGAWRADGAAMTRAADGRYETVLSMPRGTTLQYKVTRGSWETVEKTADGGEMGNRSLVADRDRTVEITVARWADDGKTRGGLTAGGKAVVPTKRGSTRTGDIRLYEKFHSQSLDNDRTVIVYLPPGYAKETQRRYPVLYMHDGQNVFDAATSFLGIEWGADETAERLIREKKIEPIIIVGVYNTPDRMNEYAPTRDKGRDAGGMGDRYSRFLIEEVKPFIDKTYRTKPDRTHTAVAGSSMGGLISLDLAIKHSDVFSAAGVISPSLMWDDREILKRVAKDPSPLKRVRLWIDMGTAEGRQIPGFARAYDDTRQLCDLLDKAGLKRGKDYQYEEVKDGQHNEAAWAARFDRILLFLCGQKLK